MVSLLCFVSLFIVSCIVVILFVLCGLYVKGLCYVRVKFFGYEWCIGVVGVC